jgi:hemerythrin superfamily protein
MVATLDDTKRSAIASKLADMKAVQNLLIANEQRFLQACSDAEICDRFRNLLEDDQKNLGILDTVIVQYGVKAEPKETIQQMVDKIQQLMQGSELNVYEKVFQHELLKHQQVMTGLTIHKAAQKVGADVLAAITPLNTVNFENRAHQEQLKGVLEILGVRELTGQDPDQGIWGRVQDAMAALSGIVGGAVTRTDNELNIQDIIRMDHTKVNTLFLQIDSTDDPQKLQEYFGQVYKDLMVHSEAEEQVVYPAVRPYYSETQELYDEQAELKKKLDEIKAISPTAPEFKSKIQDLKSIVLEHVRQEESEMFAKIRENFSDQQKEQLATQFKLAKSQLQDKLATAK